MDHGEYDESEPCRKKHSLRRSLGLGPYGSTIERDPYELSNGFTTRIPP